MWYIIAGIGAVLAGAALWVAVISARIRRYERPGPLAPADAILVFGAGVWKSGPSLSLRVRVNRAAEVYFQGLAPAILCSGGWSGGASEATVMRCLLIEKGIPAEAIIPDDGGVSTREAIHSTRWFGKFRGWKRVIAVSSPYHLYRIWWEARRQKLDVILCPAPRPGARTRQLLIFDIRQHVREIVTFTKYVIHARLEKFFSHGVGRMMHGVYRQVAARWIWLTVEADAVADANDQMAERIKGATPGFSDALAVASPEGAGLAWPLEGNVTSRFGLRYRRLHAGLDIRAGYGAAVGAAAAGRVLFTGWAGPYGNVSVVDHGAGLATLYAHLAAFIVREGETLRSGQTVGFLGKTGRSFGPHLHFEVRLHGTAVDPLVYLT
jgi:uncharacterized SAM-binding protein YcdF (DUF218 family)